MNISQLEEFLSNYNINFYDQFMSDIIHDNQVKEWINKFKLADLDKLLEDHNFSEQQIIRFFNPELPPQSIELFFEQFFKVNWRTLHKGVVNFQAQIEEIDLDVHSLSSKFPNLTVKEFRAIMFSPNEYKSIEEWKKSSWCLKAIDVDLHFPGFVEKITKKYKVHKELIDNEDEFLNRINKKQTKEELLSLLKEIGEKYKGHKYIVPGKFMKQYREEIIPIVQFLFQNNEDIKWESIIFTIQDPKLKQEDSYDSALFDSKQNEIFKIECTWTFDNEEEKRVHDFFMATYGQSPLNNSITTLEGAKEYVKNHANPPMSVFSYDPDVARIQLEKKIIQAFDKKNKNNNYDQWNGNIVLIIQYPAKNVFNDLNQESYDKIKDHIMNSNNKFKKGVFIQIHNEKPIRVD